MRIFDITDFGAIGDGATLNTRAIQFATEACRAAGGGTVRVPAGTFLTGIFEVFSSTILLVEKNGRLLASPRIGDHSVGNASVGLLYARDAHDIALTGEGVLDGNAHLFFDETRLNGGDEDFSGCDTWQKRHGLPYGTKDLRDGPLGSPNRPGNMLVFARCRHLRIENLTVAGGSYWTVHCADSEDIAIENLTIKNDLRHANNDGIHLTTCRHARIRHCRIVSGDDCIAITGFREPGGEAQIAFGLSGLVGACEDIEVSDCVLTSHSAAVRIGYGHNPVRNVRLSRLDIRASNRGIGIFARQADVENVLIEDCRIQTSLFHGNWWGRAEPIHLSAIRFWDEPGLFHIRNVGVRDLEAVGENGIVLYAEEPGAIDDIEMTRVNMTLRRGPLFENWGGNLDLRPGRPQLIAGGTAPLWAMGVSRLNCLDCKWHLPDTTSSDFSAQPVIREKP